MTIPKLKNGHIVDKCDKKTLKICICKGRIYMLLDENQYKTIVDCSPNAGNG